MEVFRNKLRIHIHTYIYIYTQKIMYRSMGTVYKQKTSRISVASIEQVGPLAKWFVLVGLPSGVIRQGLENPLSSEIFQPCLISEPTSDGDCGTADPNPIRTSSA